MSLEHDPTKRFTDRAADYVQYRPSYPAGAIDAVLAGLGLPERIAAVDVGAGTGISARLLAARGVHVIAVEPNRAMRESAESHPRVQWHEGTAETTGLDEAAYDLALAAQSFHWFRQAEALRELGRILRRGARLALMWNRRSQEDPLTFGYRRAIREIGGESSAERTAFDPRILERSGFFSPAEVAEFPNRQTLDLEGLVGRARSASYVPRTGPRAERLVELLRELHAEHADDTGRVTLVYTTELHRSRRL